MTGDEIRKELGEYISALTGTEEKIQDGTTLSELDVDSISLVKIFVFIERKFGISLLNEGLSREQIETFGALTGYLESKLESKN
jgi:acyl carrier protein